MMTSKQTRALVIALTLGLGACSSASQLLEGVTGEKDTKLPGQREAILTTNQTPTASTEGASDPVVVPAAVDNSSWLQPGGSASNAPGNLAAGASLARAWSVSAGEGSSSDGRLVASPIVVGGTVYVLDAATRVNAVSSSGSRAWSVSLVPGKADPDGVIGGGLASDGTRIYATTGFGEAVALDARTGTIAWRKKVNVSLRAAPTVSDDVMYFTGVGNEVIALRTSDGSEVWRTEGTGQRVSIIGSTSPAVAKDVIVIPTTTGDVMAYNVRDGFPTWADSTCFIGSGDGIRQYRRGGRSAGHRRQSGLCNLQCRQACRHLAGQWRAAMGRGNVGNADALGRWRLCLRHRQWQGHDGRVAPQRRGTLDPDTARQELGRSGSCRRQAIWR